MLFFNSFRQNPRLIIRMAKRDVVGRYRGSLFGVVWSFFNPILMLSVYSFVFGLVFKAKWGANTGENFSIILFTGLIFHALLGESIARAPSIIVNNSTYVKKVVFPLDSLIWVSVLSAFFHFFVSLIILFLAQAVLSQYIPWTWLYLPLVLAPLVIVCLGVSWLLASLGVFIRDISQMTGITVTILLFLCPIFYPLDVIPLEYQKYIQLNPLTIIVEEARAILVFGKAPDFSSLMAYTLCSLVFTQLCYVWFNRTKKGFSDVL